MQPIKQLQSTMLETMTTLFIDIKDQVSGKDLKELFNSHIFIDKRNNDIEKNVRDYFKVKNIVLADKVVKEIAYLHQLYSDPNSSDLGKVGDDKIGEFRSFMRGTFAASRKVEKYAQGRAGVFSGIDAKNSEVIHQQRIEPPRARPQPPSAQEIQEKFEPQKRHPQFDAWSQMLKNDVYDDSLNWLALHAGVPVSKETSRNEKVQQIMERMQDRREVDLLPSLLVNLGAANVALKMGNAQHNLSNSRIVLMYKMFSNISHNQMDKLNLIIGAPRNSSVPAIQQFATLFDKYSADQMYQLMSDPIVSMANVLVHIHPIYNAGAMASAALRSESRVPPQPAVSQPMYKQAAPVFTAVSQPVSKQAAPAPQPAVLSSQPLQTPTQQYAAWAKILQMKASEDTLDWLALHTNAPVNRFTSREGKVEQIIQKLQSTREIDLLPSLLRALGDGKVTDQLGNAPVRDVSNNRTVLLYRMLDRMDPDAIMSLYRFVGMPQNTSDSPAKLFSNLVEFNSAETLKELLADLGLNHLLGDVDALYSSGGIPSASLGTGNVFNAPPPAVKAPSPLPPQANLAPDLTKGKSAPSTPNVAPVQQAPRPTGDLDRVEKAFYDVYLKNGDFSHMPFVTLQFAMNDHIDSETVKRLVRHYQAPVRIQTGSELIDWLKGQWDPATNQSKLTNKPESIEKFLETYRKYRQAAPETTQATQASVGSFGGADLIETAYQSYVKSQRDHGAYITFKFAVDGQMTSDAVKRLVQFYRAPVRIKTGSDLLTWLEGQPDAAGRGPRLVNNAASVAQFMEEYRKNR
ncbi:MAG: hypothetical protein LLG04_14145 [Parachlamydia sp.]|nr:hypothetical protein [Parachlamydia sp.]